MGIHLEYIGFKANETSREYLLRLRSADGDPQHFTVIIPNTAFLSHRVRYQDAPEICFLKLQRELTACVETLPARELEVSDAELEEYRESHTARPRQSRPKQNPR